MLKANGHAHGPRKYVGVQDAKRLSKALETAQAQSAKHYRAVLRWMTYCKVKHDALALAWGIATNGGDISLAARNQIEAALDQHLEVEGEEQWLARTIMLTDALDQYLKIMEQDEPDPDAMQKAFVLVKERHFVFMPAGLEEQPNEG